MYWCLEEKGEKGFDPAPGSFARLVAFLFFLKKEKKRKEDIYIMKLF